MVAMQRLFCLCAGTISIDDRMQTTEASVKVGKDTIAIVKTGEGRILTLNGTIFSMVKDGTPYTGLYWDLFVPLPSLFESASVLVIGLGGGTIPRQLKDVYGDRIVVDVVEISREMVGLSERFAPGLSSRVNIIVGDGLDYVSREASKYDIIILDAYGPNLRIPRGFLAKEFVASTLAALKPDGLFAVNYVFTLRQFLAFPGYLRALRRGFHSVYMISDGPFLLSNLVMVCSKSISSTELRRRIRERFPSTSETERILGRF